MKRLTLLSFLFSLALAGSAAAQGLTPQETARIAAFEAGLSSASPAAARAMAADRELMDKLMLLEPERAADLKAKAAALANFERQLDKEWEADQARNLSTTLALLLTKEGPLAKMGLAPQPEKTLAWAAKNKTYSAEKTRLIGKALKNWEAIFDGFSFNPKMQNAGGTSYLTAWTVKTSTGAYFLEIGRSDFIFRNTPAAMRTFWLDLTLRERNDYLASKAASLLSGAFIDGSTRTDANFQGFVSGFPTFEYLDAAGKGRLDRYISQMKAAEDVKAKLSATQLANLKTQTVEQQMLQLGSLFDKSEARTGVVAERTLDANRPSRPDENISAQNNDLITGMLRSSLTREIKGSAPGDRVAAFYAAGNKLDIAIESCQGCHAKYEPSSGRIIIDSELVQQYLRANNITPDALVKDKFAMAGLTKYISPIFVHEATHQMQHKWAADAGVYKPYTQEDEMEALSMEALHTSQKKTSDLRYRFIFVKMGKSSTYAQQRVEVSKRFEGNQEEFGEFVRKQYYYGVPSFDAASSQVLSAVSGELERRRGLSAAEIKDVEDFGKDLNEARKMSAQEIADSVGDIKASALTQLQKDLMNSGVYTQHYAGAEDWAASMSKAGASSKRTVVPAV
ncbi:MAG: hypothetical protein A2X31_10205 [Elusimicrobia bacterium GWB2_63_22]|nr:MAG: hypothetical protein A2X31_10205 [Elusimicrobia bacterium GWB2_63_22]